MGNGWHEWPLVIFTVLGQCVVGGFMVMAWALLRHGVDSAQGTKINRHMFFLWLLMGIGFVASVLHLGSPWRAMNALNRLGASPLSNEIALGSLFFALGGVFWLLRLLEKISGGLARLWLMVTLLVGVGFLYAMIRVYLIDTVPTWNNGFTPVHFLMTALLGGPLLGYVLLRAAGETDAEIRWLPVFSLCGLVVSMVAILWQTTALPEIHSSVQQATQLVPAYAGIQIFRWLLLIAGLSLWWVPLFRRRPSSVGVLALGSCLVIGGELLGRVIFYGLHMTVGMAVAG
ncbi:DmsC/YnfH family molybdoenzyme membrane anchor subunit [Musicola keenii]|uniref:DmsC/YnfH family molybdoenzyme membrane anchor subunit n=1 Tax=Musicola keenii TaxID=2884250 RepID=UPI001786B3EB|nr:DmsC/YnfH family molybdoenzyme membrane anchor subunit [Musicola keenii]